MVGAAGVPGLVKARVRLVEVALSAPAAEESVTLNVSAVELGVLTVPERTPPLLNVMPEGSVPEATLHVSVPLPPLAASVALYAVPVVPAARVVVVTAGAGLTVRLSVALDGDLVAVTVAMTAERRFVGAL